MKMSMVIALAVALVAVSSFVVGAEGSAGTKDYGDSCSLLASGVQFLEALGNGKNQYRDACDVSKGLVCAVNVCKCAIGEYKQNFIEQVFGGGQCSGSTKVSVGFAMMLSVVPILYFFKN